MGEDALEIPDPPFAVLGEDDDAAAAGAPLGSENLFAVVGGGRELSVEATEPGFGVGVEDAGGAF